MPPTATRAPADGLRVFRGAVAVVTGGASGIGRAFCEALAARGAEVVVADRDGGPAEELASAIREAGGKASAAPLDVRDPAAFEELIAATVGRCGRLDYLFNNAGIAVGGEAVDYRPEHWRKVLDVDLNGVVHGIQAAYPLMVRQGFGQIVNTASMAGLIPTAGGVGYGAAKHGVVGLSRSLRIEAARRGVRVNALCPGVIRTGILEGGGRHGELLQPVSLETQRRMWNRLRPLDPARFAARALKAIARNRAIIIVPGWWRLVWWLDRLSPACGEAISRWIFERTLTRLFRSTAAAAEERQAAEPSLTRRTLLVALPAAGALAGCRVIWSDDELAERLVAATVWRQREAWTPLGEAYLEAYPDDRSALIGKLARHIGWRHLARPEGLRQRIRERIREDFRSRRTARLEGWVLSRTEAWLAALLALEARRC